MQKGTSVTRKAKDSPILEDPAAVISDYVRKMLKERSVKKSTELKKSSIEFRHDMGIAYPIK